MTFATSKKVNTVRILIIALLCFSIVLEGCYSSVILDEKQLATGRPNEAEGVVITLSNGDEIEVEPFHHINVTEPSDLIYGVGRRTHRYTGKDTEFTGQMIRSSIDSIKIVKIDSLNDITCYLPDSTQIQFLGKDNVIVTPEQGAGFYCAGILKTKQRTTNFSGKISGREIVRLEVKEFSWKNTATLVFGSLGGVAVILVTVLLVVLVVYGVYLIIWIAGRVGGH